MNMGTRPEFTVCYSIWAISVATNTILNQEGQNVICLCNYWSIGQKVPFVAQYIHAHTHKHTFLILYVF